LIQTKTGESSGISSQGKKNVSGADLGFWCEKKQQKKETQKESCIYSNHPNKLSFTVEM